MAWREARVGWGRKGCMAVRVRMVAARPQRRPIPGVGIVRWPFGKERA